MIKQQILSRDNVDKITISPYADIYGEGTGRVLLVRRDTGKRLLMESSNHEGLSALIMMLESGAARKELELLFERESVSGGLDWIALGLEKGVLE